MLAATGFKAECIREYSYFDKPTKSLDFAGMTADLEVKKFPWYKCSLKHASLLNTDWKTWQNMTMYSKILVFFVDILCKLLINSAKDSPCG